MYLFFYVWTSTYPLMLFSIPSPPPLLNICIRLQVQLIFFKYPPSPCLRHKWVIPQTDFLLQLISPFTAQEMKFSSKDFFSKCDQIGSFLCCPVALQLCLNHTSVKETLARVFSCEFCEVFKNRFFTEHLLATASENILIFLKECLHGCFTVFREMMKRDLFL